MVTGLRAPGVSALLALACCLPLTAQATTIHVPADQPTIQAGIDAASAGDTVLVAPGTYVENIVIDHDVAVRSAGGPAVTVIDGGSPEDPLQASVVWIEAGSIEDFSIQNGTGTRVCGPGCGATDGAGVFVRPRDGAVPLVSGNWIHDNQAAWVFPGEGGGIYVDVGFEVGCVGYADIVGNRIYNNSARSGTAISFNTWSCNGFDNGGLIEGNEIFDQHPLGSRAVAVEGGEVVVRDNVMACNFNMFHTLKCQGTVESNTVVTNFSDSLRAAVQVLGARDLLAVVRANNITDNLGPGLTCFQGQFPPFSEYIVECNNIRGNFPGGQVLDACSDAIGQNDNISVDPEYGRFGCEVGQDSFCLGESSPLLPENSPPGCGLIGGRGACPPIGVRDAEPASPGRLRALPARPNPFAERTTIAFLLADGAEVQVWIYNVLGRRLRTLSPGWLFAGEHALEWDGRDDDGARVASAAYVARIRAGGQELTRTLLLVR